MKYRKLRIAWSVGWGVACLLLVMLWVRSYWWYDTVYYVQSPVDFLYFGSVAGLIFVEDDDDMAEMGAVGLAPTQTSWFTLRAANEPIDMPRFKLLFREFVFRPDYAVPYWFLALSAATFAALPWLRWSNRFSLRTLLIAMTVAAIGLGLVVYAFRR